MKTEVNLSNYTGETKSIQYTGTEKEVKFSFYDYNFKLTATEEFLDETFYVLTGDDWSDELTTVFDTKIESAVKQAVIWIANHV